MQKRSLLITGASGNIGFELIRGLKEIGSGHRIIAGDYQIEQAKKVLWEFENLEHRYLDFSNPETFSPALDEVDVVFLLRPPNLANVPKYFAPFFEAMKSKGIKKIVFLSVQGVENQKAIPHHKLENLILDNKMEYAFLRPSYFMQNLTTTLIQEIKSENTIFIPAGKVKFNWVDATDIGLVGAFILNDFENFKNQAYEITGSEFENFYAVAELLSDHIGRKINYKSPSLLHFYSQKRKQGIAGPMILVMIMLHYLPRFSKNPKRLTSVVKEITGRDPGLLQKFIEREKAKFSN